MAACDGLERVWAACLWVPWDEFATQVSQHSQPCDFQSGILKHLLWKSVPSTVSIKLHYHILKFILAIWYDSVSKLFSSITKDLWKPLNYTFYGTTYFPYHCYDFLFPVKISFWSENGQRLVVGQRESFASFFSSFIFI